MRTYRPRTGPFILGYHLEPQEIDDLCLDALRKGKFLPTEPAPVRIEAFIESYFECGIDYRDLGPGVLGCTSFSDMGKVLEVVVSSRLTDDNTEGNDRRLNSTFAHEAGHCLLHAGLFIDAGKELILRDDVDLSARKILCRDDQVGYDRSGKVRWWEYQANRAIGGFLLPRVLIDRALEPYFKRGPVSQALELDEAHRREAELFVADTFKVNPVVARYRLEEFYPQSNGQLSF